MTDDPFFQQVYTSEQLGLEIEFPTVIDGRAFMGFWSTVQTLGGLNDDPENQNSTDEVVRRLVAYATATVRLATRARWKQGDIDVNLKNTDNFETGVDVAVLAWLTRTGTSHMQRRTIPPEL